jgi:hypothetical protein
MLPHKRMKPSVYVQIDPGDEIMEGAHLSQRVGNYRPNSAGKAVSTHRLSLLKLWRR